MSHPVRSSSLVSVLAVVSCLAVLGGPVASFAQSCPTMVWADEFDGSALDTVRWTPQIGDGCDIGLCGWGNNELQYYKAENATVAGGLLTITAKKERVRGSQYTSARLRTLGKGEWTFGRFEARMRLPVGQGIWPAFWMLPTDEVYGGWPQSGEIDVMENIGSEPSTVHGTIHFGDPYPNNRSTGASYVLHDGARFTDAFHTFAIERSPGVIRWLVDDVLYSTKTTADTTPSIWPFDERFHFLVNVAVGGNWPGSPDATTVFPQTLDVDWVRVHDGYLPYLAGPRRVAHQATGVEYSVGNLTSPASVGWTVPAGAAIVSGQGSGTIVVDWGDAGGTVVADVSDACGARQLAVDVEVEPPYTYQLSFENFDDPENVVLDAAGTTGTLVEVANPGPDALNGSATAGEYTRDPSAQYDVLVYDVAILDDATAYVERQKKFFLDVHTTAPVGTQILLQLEDGATATPSNYPAGRHSRFQAFTTTQGQWERLELAFLDRPDGGVADAAVDTMIVLFAPGVVTSGTYVFDNFDGYVAGTSSGGGEEPTSLHVAAVAVGTAGAGKGQKRGTATVTVADDQGSPVAGATVAGTFSGAFAESVSGPTDAAGSVTFTTTASAGGNPSFTFCVDAVSHPSLVYAPAANVATCASR